MTTILGTGNGETIDAQDGVTSGADIIFGLDGNDVIFGLGGDDILKGGGGADILFGGPGIDTADYSDSDEAVDVNLQTGQGHYGTAAGDQLFSIDNLNGSPHDDLLIGHDGDNTLKGLAGWDVLIGNGGNDTLEGGEGFDVLVGGAGADKLIGGAGLDNASYETSTEGVEVSLKFGAGHYGEAEGDTLEGIEGLIGSDHDDDLLGNDVGNHLEGRDGDDVLKGYGGADSLNGGPGADLMYGGLGGDLYEVDQPGDDVVEYANQGTDIVKVAFGYTLPINVEYLMLAEEAGSIDGTGNADDNWVVGNQGNNVLDGDAGGDTLVGYMGTDKLIGGAGADTFIWTDIAQSGLTQDTFDLIADFDILQGDKIDISDIDADETVAGNQAFTFIGATPPPYSGPAQIRYGTDGTDTFIVMNTDGDPGDNDFVIKVAGVHTVDASWFVL